MDCPEAPVSLRPSKETGFLIFQAHACTRMPFRAVPDIPEAVSHMACKGRLQAPCGSSSGLHGLTQGQNTAQGARSFAAGLHKKAWCGALSRCRPQMQRSNSLLPHFIGQASF